MNTGCFPVYLGPFKFLFNNLLWFSDYKAYTTLVIFISKYFIISYIMLS